MAKFLIYSDIHIHSHKKSLDRLEDCLKTLDWIFRTACQYNIKNVLFAGDLFQHRQKIDIYAYQRTFEILQKYQDVLNHWLLIGNHDMWQNEGWDVSSLVPLGAIKNVSIINRPCTMTIDGSPISFLPYTKSPIETLRGIENDCEKPRILIAHIAVDGAILNVRANTYSEELVEHDGDMVKVDASIFNNWDQVFLGHYHAEQRLTDKIEYIGSPLELSYGEAFQKKHIIIYDSETGKKEYIENTFSPKHYICSPHEVEQINFGEKAFIKIQTNNLPENVELQRKLISTQKFSEVKIEPIKRKLQEEKLIIENAKAILADEEEMAQKYIEQVGLNGLLKSKLLEVFNTIRKEKEKKENLDG